jgi:hypothetical protein
MLIEEIRALLRTQPFHPFYVHLSDGTAVHIHHHDYAWLMPSGAMLFAQEPSGKFHFIQTAQITKFTFDAPQATAA